MVAVTLVRSPSGAKPKTRGTIRALGLRTIGETRMHVLGPVVQGMILSAGRLVRADLVGGDLVSLSPPLPLIPTEFEYPLPEGSRGEVRIHDGRMFRLEIREASNSRAVSWTTNGSASRFFKTLYGIGSSDCEVYIVKEGYPLYGPRQWISAIPDLLLSSASKVQLVRLQREGESIIWERRSDDGYNYDGELWLQLALGRTSKFLEFANTQHDPEWVAHVGRALRGEPT